MLEMLTIYILQTWQLIYSEHFLFTGVVESALRKAPNCDPQGCEISRIEVNDGLHV